MTTNQQIIEKAAMSVSNLASGGLLNVQQFNTFYRKLIDTPTILRQARTVQMHHDTMKIEKIGFGQRVLKPGVENTPLADGDRSVPTTSTVNLSAKEVIAEVNISYDTLENNIEQGNLTDTILSLLADRVALDAEELIINGDTASADPYLSLINGLRKKAVTNVVDFADAALSKDLFFKMYKKMPAKYIRNPRDFKFYTTYGNRLDWTDAVAARQTNLGDSGLSNGTSSVPTAYGIDVEGIAMLPSYVHNTKNVADAFLVNPKNIIVGISRNMRIEVDKDIRARQFIFVLTMKLDTTFEEEEAVVKAINVLQQ
jgi:hypothetical protein